jgi:RNA polymerase sigma-70 factor (sigma-E family)
MTFSSEAFEATGRVAAAAWSERADWATGASTDTDGTPDPAGSELAALFRSHHLDLVRLATMLTGDRSTAEDVVQDAFERVHAARDRLAAAGGGFGVSYLRTAVINGSRQVHRRRNVARRHEKEQPGEAGQVSAEQEVLSAERHREVAAALARLPRRRREVLVLRYYLELSEAEIAETLNISPGTVKSSAARGLAALAKSFGEKP